MLPTYTVPSYLTPVHQLLGGVRVQATADAPETKEGAPKTNRAFPGCNAWKIEIILTMSESTNSSGRNQAVDAPRLNSSLSISRGVAPPRICRGVSLSSFCTHATCSGVTVAKSVPFL